MGPRATVRWRHHCGTTDECRLAGDCRGRVSHVVGQPRVGDSGCRGACRATSCSARRIRDQYEQPVSVVPGSSQAGDHVTGGGDRPGDAVSGGQEVVNAAAEGRKAARGIKKYLTK